MEDDIRRFFVRYEASFNRALAGEIAMEEVATLYAAAFVAATPAGVVAGQNDAALRQAMAEGYGRQRALGTKAMCLRDLRLSPIDAGHCLAHVAWTATYARPDQPDIAIDFDVHYLMRVLDGAPQVFGWVSGDEQALLARHGIV